MGIATTLPATGLDQSRTDLVGPGRAISQFADKFAYRCGDDVVILTPDNAPRQFTARDGYLIEARLDTELLRDALAHSGLPLLAYQEQWYH